MKPYFFTISFVLFLLHIIDISRMLPQSQSELFSPKKRSLTRRLTKLLKQQQSQSIPKHIQPGKVTIHSTPRCRPRVVNFFGDISTQIFCLHVSDDEQYVAAGCENGDVRVYHIFEGKLVLMGNSSRLKGYPNTGIRWRPGGSKELTACNADGTIRWYDRAGEKVLGHYESEIGYLCTDYNCNGAWSVYGNERYQIEVFDSETKAMLVKYDAGAVEQWNPNHVNRIFCVKGVKKQPSLFYSGGWDSTVRLWDVRVPGEYVRKFYGPSISSQSLDLKDNVLLVGNYSNKQTVQLWDFGTGKLIQNIDLKQENQQLGGGAYCLCAGYAHKSKYDLFAAGLTAVNKVKVFERKEKVAEVEFQTTPLALSFYQYNGKDFLVSGGIEGTIYVIKLKMDQV